MFTLLLSPEISLYPYLISRGLIPYQNLIDQHFPLLFFGPFHLGQLGVTTPQASLILFFVILLLTNLFAFLKLKKNLLFFILFIVFQLVLRVQTFWVESFILFFLVIYFYFNDLKSNIFSLIAALSLSFIFGLRPTLLIFCLFLILVNSRQKLIHFIALPLIFLLEIIWLLKNQLFLVFLEIQGFNVNFYAKYGVLDPTIKEIVLITSIFFILAIIAFSNKKIFKVGILSLCLLVLVYPRFGLPHLLPLSALILFVAPTKTHPWLKKITIFWIIFALISIRRQFTAPLDNYYYPPKLYTQASYLATHYEPNTNYYFFGGPDQLYQLTNTTPIGGYYLPSLPWYFKNPVFVEDQISALSNHPQSLVVVNRASSLAGVSLLDYGQPIWNYIDQNYQKIDQVDNLEIYQIKK